MQRYLSISACGETARSIGERAREHLVKYEQNEKNSVFYKHMLDRHDSISQDINVDILAMCSGDAMLRQVTAAVFINMEPNTEYKRRMGKLEQIKRTT